MADEAWGGTFNALEGEGRRLSEVSVAPNRITFAFRCDGAMTRLEAVSRDGMFFHARFGYPRVSPEQTAELILYRAGGRLLLYGRWMAPGAEGRWLFELRPETSAT